METADGLPVLSRADAVRMKAWDDLEKAYRDGTSVKGRVIDRIKGGLRWTSTASPHFCRARKSTFARCVISTACVTR